MPLILIVAIMGWSPGYHIALGGMFHVRSRANLYGACMAIVHAYVCIVFKKSHENFPIVTWLGIRPVPNYFLNCTNFILLDC